MSESVRTDAGPVRVAIVGAAADDVIAMDAQLHSDTRVTFCAVCVEGVDFDRGALPEHLDCHVDFNMLLHDSDIELVVVAGPVERRRDLAVRALNGGRHVVTAAPFAETPRDAARIMKTAARQGLMATMDIPWRSDPDLRALLAALQHPLAPHVHSLAMQRLCEDDAPGICPAVLDMVNLVLPSDLRSVTTYLDAAPGLGYMLILPLRHGGWATVRVTDQEAPGVPQFIVSGAAGTIIVDDGRATIRTATGGHCVEPVEAPDFWAGVFSAVRSGQPHPFSAVDIVRGMKLHSAAEESAATGQPVSI